MNLNYQLLHQKIISPHTNINRKLRCSNQKFHTVTNISKIKVSYVIIEEPPAAVVVAPPPPPPVATSSNPLSKLLSKVRGNKEVPTSAPKQAEPKSPEPKTPDEPGKVIVPQKPAQGFGLGISSQELLSRVPKHKENSSLHF